MQKYKLKGHERSNDASLTNKSQIGQDLWVIDKMKGKIGGTFLDIGGGHPIKLNNTYLLEKKYNWEGVSIDLGPPGTHMCENMSLQEYKSYWENKRNTPLVCADALKLDYGEMLEKFNLPTTIDYLSMDLEPPRLTTQCLNQIPFSKYQFNVITFETDSYRDNTTLKLSRDFLTPLGYILVESDQQEDWYVHRSFVG